jgi:uncharacterized phiE125 gp8 family phage protein
MLIAPNETPPAVSLDDAKAQVHADLDDTSEDGLIQSYIVAATMAAEHELGRALVSQNWTLRLAAFPAGAIELARPPVQQVLSITYLDGAGDEQTLDPAQYALCADPLVPVVTGSWPDGTGVTVTFKAGYGAAAENVPEAIRAWILLQVADLHANRESTGEPAARMPFVAGLLDRYRVVRVS